MLKQLSENNLQQVHIHHHELKISFIGEKKVTKAS
jgi:hypothetical protein